MENKSKRIDLRVSENELSRIDKLSAKAKMSRSQYLIASALGEHITVFDGGKEIAYQLSKIGGNLNSLKILAHQGKISVVYLNEFVEEVNAVWLLLSSLISGTEPMRE